MESDEANTAEFFMTTGQNELRESKNSSRSGIETSIISKIF